MKDKIKKLFSNVWTVPNVLTMLRLVMIPVFVVLFVKAHPVPDWRESLNVWLKASLAVFVLASLTDMLDGFLARKLNQITDFGKLFDPLADKLMVLTAMVCQAVVGVFPWIAIAIVAAKELYMVLGGIFMLSRNVVVYSNLVGKAAQVCFVVSLVLSFFHREFAEGKVFLWNEAFTPDIIMLWITVGLAVLAMVIYTADYVRKSKTPADS